MLISLFFIGFAIVYPLLIGGIFMNIFCLKVFSKLSFWAMSFGLGLWLISFWELFLIYNHFKLSLLNVAGPLTLIMVCGYLLSIFCFKSGAPIDTPDVSNQLQHEHPMKKIGRYGLAGIIFIQFVMVVVLNQVLPISTWDGIYAIAVKSKYFYEGGHLAGLKNFFITSSYPLQVELSLSWMAVAQGAWNDQTVKIIFPMMLLAYLVFQYECVKQWTSRFRAMLSCCLLTMSYFLVYHATIEYRAIFFMYYNIIPALLIFHSFYKSQTSYLFLAGIFAGIGTFVKLEGMGHLAIYFCLISYCLYTYKRQLLKEWIITYARFYIPAVLIAVPFTFIKKFYNLGDFEGRLGFNFSGLIGKAEVIFEAYFNNLMMSGNWNILWLLLAVCLITATSIKRNLVLTRFLAMSLFLYFGLYFIIGLLTNTYYILFLDANTNLSRAILHFFPLCPILIAILI